MSRADPKRTQSRPSHRVRKMMGLAIGIEWLIDWDPSSNVSQPTFARVMACADEVYIAWELDVAQLFRFLLAVL